MSYNLSSKLSYNFGTVSASKLVPDTVEVNVASITTDTYTMAPVDAGCVFVLNKTSGSTVTLPPLASSEGFTATILVGATAASHVIVSPTASKIVGSVVDCGTSGNHAIITPRTSMTVGSSGTRSVVGDQLRIICDGTHYYLNGQVVSSGSIIFA
jgi:hypothetical protein